MAYKVIILYRLYMPSYFLGTFTEYPFFRRVPAGTRLKGDTLKLETYFLFFCTNFFIFRTNLFAFSYKLFQLLYKKQT